jgi:kinetochore protein Spc7/SPC105
MTLGYRNELELFFHPFAFQDGGLSSSSSSKAANNNAPISLVCSSKEAATAVSDEQSTVQRFFLQLLRAQLLSLPQAATSIASLLQLVSRGWDKCRALTEYVRHLQMIGMTDVTITGDEQLEVVTAVVLPQVETKVRVVFGVSFSTDMPAESGVEVLGKVAIKARVVYGEKYDEPKMGEFLKTFCGDHVGDAEAANAWADAVDDLRKRLIKRGRKT